MGYCFNGCFIELGNEEATRTAADSALDARITSAETEIGNVKSSVSTLQDAVSGEITRATSAETALQTAITAEPDLRLCLFYTLLTGSRNGRACLFLSCKNPRDDRK